MSIPKKLKDIIDQFCLRFSTQEQFEMEPVQKLLEQVRQTFDLDCTYLLEALAGYGQFHSLCCSRKEGIEWPDTILPFSEEQMQTASQREQSGILRTLHPVANGNVDNFLDFGFISGGIYQGSVGFRAKRTHQWTPEEEETLCCLGRTLKMYLYARRVETNTSWDLMQPIQALKRLYNGIFAVSIWEDSYQIIQASQNLKGTIPTKGSYSFLVAQYMMELEPDFQESAYYRLSSEYICSRLGPDTESFHIDCKHLMNGHMHWQRLSITVIDRLPDGLVNHILFTIQEIPTPSNGRDLQQTAFSLMRGGYCRVAYVDLNDDALINLLSDPEELYGEVGYAGSYFQVFQAVSEHYVLPEYREKFQTILSVQHLKSMFDQGAPYVALVFQRLIHGKPTWVQTEVVPLSDYSEDNARMMWYVHNISEEKAKEDTYQKQLIQANAELRSSLSTEKQYRMALLADSYFYCIFDVTNNGLIQEEFLTKGGVNPIQAVTGQPPPKSFEDFIHQWHEHYHPVLSRKSAAENDIFTLDYLCEAFARNERILDVEVKQTPPPESGIAEFMQVFLILSEDEASGHIMGCMVWKDISALRKAELQSRIALQEAYDAANNANKAKSEFLSRMSHDIRTPLNAVIGMTAIAATHLDDPERVSNCLGKITTSSKHLLSLINEVLDMSKIESGKVDLNEEEFNLSELIDSLVTIIRPDVSAKHHELHIQINNVQHEKVIGDSLRIQQSFVNLLGNAVKYTPPGGRLDLIITEKPCRQPQFGCYEFVFQDNGIGMTKEYVDHIFEPFTRANDSRVHNIQGTGLGMAITNNLVRMMNGNIKVESELGKGSRFTVTIFLRLQEDAEMSCDEFSGLPVLVCDDEEEICLAACHILDDMGMHSEWVMTGEEAARKVELRHERDEDYFAIILDWKMPGMDGVETAREIRRRVGNDVPIIILSAYDWSDVELEARAAGADAFISKPLFKSRFVYLFREMVEGTPKDSAPSDPIKEFSNKDFSGKNILLVEDNELNAEIATEILQMSGLSVEWAENGQIAVERVSEAKPNTYQLIFMDIQMPVMNGNDAARAIRALPRPDAKTIPIVAMTANAFTEDIQTALGAGMNEHIAKPLDFKQLMNILERWL